MLTDDPAGSLAAALDALSALAGDDERAALAGLRGRLADHRLRVLVAGEAKRGKSTLVNALLARPVLPAGVTPLTALATTVRYGRAEQVSATFADGRAETFPLTALDDLVTERGNPGNRRGLADVTVTVDAPLLRHGVELVDTPGTGSVYAHNTAQAQAALETMDAAVFVLSADPPVSASERELIGRVAELSVAMFVVLNKADHLDGGELAEVMEFTALVAAEAAGRPVRVYPMSARAADAGFAGFAADFLAYLELRRGADLRRSASRHAARIASALRDEVLMERHALQARGSEATARVREFADRLAAVRDRAGDAGDLARAQSQRLLSGLNESASLAGKEGTAMALAQLEDLLAGQLRSAPAAEIERAGRDRLGEIAVSQAERWRAEQAKAIEAALGELTARLDAGLRAELQAIRESAAELLGLDLAVAGPATELAPDLRFFYASGDDPGQVELLAGAVRRLLPGEAGRVRAREHLRRVAAELAPQQIGRARADLQYRLSETTRHLVRAIAEQYEEGTRRLERALARAAQASTATAGEIGDRDRELTARLADIDAVIARLGSADAASSE